MREPVLKLLRAVAVLAAVAAGQLRAPALGFDGGMEVWRTAHGDEAAIERADNALGSEVTVGFERAGEFSARMALVNHGRYPVHVVGFPDRGAYSYGLESVETASDADGPARSFRPFTLRRGATRWLVLHFRFADCYLEHAGAGTVVRTTLPVSYRVFGLHHKQAVPFSRFGLSVPDGRCDHPVL
ncbi:MAG TPA: hypothetical protein VGP90_12045 [Acidimicrobiia bacterium]|nr:hypothetical protein [Acidimicrobiia bacterium]